MCTQAKDVLRTPASAFGSECIIPDSFVEHVCSDSNFVETIVELCR